MTISLSYPEKLGSYLMSVQMESYNQGLKHANLLMHKI